MSRTLLCSLALAAFVAVGCRDSTAPRERDLLAPAAPRALISTTGDHVVYLRWLANTEHDVTEYRIYEGLCSSGPDCPYDRVGNTSGTTFTVTGLPNGATRYFAISAVDRAGNESALSYEEVHDTPRPEGFGLGLTSSGTDPAHSGYDFSSFSIRPFDDEATDVYFSVRSGAAILVAPFEDTEVQDAGYGTSLDAVDWAPGAGWAPSGTVELIVGHCYVVWTHDNHFAKLRVTSLGATSAVLDWAYQVDVGNRELMVYRGGGSGPRVRRVGAVQ